MGEIKSTLDLVMERTRHLSLTAEEREAQRQEAFEKRLQGLLQQYADEALTAEAFHQETAALQTAHDAGRRRELVAAVLGRVDPDRANHRWLALMEDLAPDVCQPLRDLLQDHRRKRDRCRQAARDTIADRLADQYGIRGSAVVPNADRDSATRKELNALRDETRASIAALASAVT